MILFLNKKDLFAEKLLTKKISDIPAFKDYTGNNDYNSGMLILDQLFIRITYEL